MGGIHRKVQGSIIMGRKKQKNSNIVLVRLSRKLFVMVLLIGLPIGIFLFTFYMKSVTVVGASRYTEEEVLQMLSDSKLDTNTLFFYLKHKYFQSVDIPFIQKIDVEMEDNHTIKLYVYEKKVAGCVAFLGEYLYFDKDGIVVESSPNKLENVLQVEGLKHNEMILGKKLEVQNDEIFDSIINITHGIEKFDLDVSKIRFNKKYEVTIYSNDIKVLLGKRDNYDMVLNELKNILEEAKGMKITIDMSDYQKDTQTIIAKPSTD